MFTHKTIRLFFAISIVLLVISYLSGLHIDVTRDAGKYATVSKEIFENGNYINLTVHGEPYDQKPPMLFWLGAIGFKIGGISNFWFKFPILILIFLGFYWAYMLGKSLYNKRVGLITSTLLGFSFIYSLYSSDIHTDTPLQAFIILAMWQLFEFIKTRKDKYWIVGFIAIGLAMLCKGPIGAAIPGFAVIGHILLKRDFRLLFNYRWFLGIILAFVVASPALIGLMNQFGWKGIWFFFWENNVGRLTGTYVAANSDPLFYVHNLLYLFLPWSLLFYASAFMEFKTLIRNRFKANEYFTFAGIWIFFIILNSSKSQLPNYIFSIIPLIAVLTAKWIDLAIESPKLYKIFKVIQDVVVGILWVLIFALVFYIFPNPPIYIWALLLLAFTGVLYVILMKTEPGARLLLPSIISFVLLSLLLTRHVLPFTFSFQAPPKAARYFNQVKKPQEKLYNFNYSQYELFFYSAPQATQVHKSEELQQIVKPNTWIFTDPPGLDTLQMLAQQPDTIIEYRHLYLNRPAKFLLPTTRESSLEPMYLIKY